MIRVERDPAFWAAVAGHPALTGAMMGLSPADVTAATASLGQKPRPWLGGSPPSAGSIFRPSQARDPKDG